MDLDPDTNPLTLSGRQTIREAAATHAALLSALQVNGDIILACDDITEVDLSFIQMILAARRSATESGRKLTLRQPADGALRQALIAGGLISEGALPSRDPAEWGTAGGRA